MWWLLYATPIVLTSYYVGGKVLRNVLIAELNEQLNVRATVNAVNLNGLRTFPNLSIELTNVRINESQPHYNQYLLQARRVFVKFNPLTLLKGNNEIDKIELSGGALRLFTDKTGNTNFDIFKPDSTSSETKLNIDLKHVVMKGFRCVYVDQTQDQSLNFETEELLFSGKFKDDTYTLKTRGDGLFDHLTLGGVDYVIGKKIRTDLELEIDQKINAYHIEKGKIGMDNLMLDVNGDILLVGSEPDLDLTFNGTHIDVQAVISVLPNDVAYSLRDLKSSGQIDVSGKLLGRFTENSWPDINVSFGFVDASVISKTHDLNCQKINLTGTLKNPVSKKLDMHIDLEELNMKKSSVSGMLDIKDIATPNIDFALKGLVDFEDVKGLIVDNPPEVLTGKSLFNVEGALPYNDTLNQLDFNASTVHGDIELRDINYDGGNGSLIKQLFAKCRIKGDVLNQVEIKGELWKNDVNFAGTIENWQTYLVSQKRLRINGNLKSNTVNLDFIRDSTSNPDTTSLITFNYDIDTDLNLEVADFVWSNFKAKNLSGRFVWDERGMLFRNLIFDAWGGTNQLDGELLEFEEAFALSSTSISENVAIEQLLKDFDNFGQTEFTPEILQGRLTTTIDLKMLFDRRFNVIEDSFKSLADVHIENGRLKDYAAMESLSSFVDLDDLQDIKFKELNNTIEIYDRTIFIPSMNIQNNALNVEISGTHNFDNYMNYQLKIRITELLANKSGWVKRKKERQLEENKDGGLSAFILMVGTPDNLKIKYDRKAVKDKIKNEVKKERQNFFKELKREIRREKSPTEDRKKVEWDDE